MSSCVGQGSKGRAMEGGIIGGRMMPARRRKKEEKEESNKERKGEHRLKDIQKLKLERRNNKRE